MHFFDKIPEQSCNVAEHRQFMSVNYKTMEQFTMESTLSSVSCGKIESNHANHIGQSPQLSAECAAG